MNPEAIPHVKNHHLRRLERRRNYLLAEIAQCDEYPGRSFDRSEAAALSAVLADFRERGYDWPPHLTREKEGITWAGCF